MGFMSKLFGNNDKEEKLRLGRERIGTPGLQTREAIQSLAGEKDFAGFRYDAIGTYYDTFLMRALTEELEKAHTARTLAEIEPDSVKVAFIMLVRELIRKHQEKIVPDGEKAKWKLVELFTLEALKRADAPAEPYAEWIAKHATEKGDEDAAVLCAGLAKKLGIDAQTLYQLHEGMCEVVGEDILK